MKKILVFLLSITIGFMLAGCGNDDSDGKIVIDFWHMSPTGSESFSGVKNIINTYNKSQDKYYVKGMGFSFWDYWDKINVAIASNNAPEIGIHTLDNVVFRAENKALHNISDLIEKDGENTLDPNIFYQNQLDFVTYDNDLYALPFTATTRVLFYNLDMFAEAGLTEADVPTTWSELEVVAKKLDKVDDGDIVQIGFDPTYGAGTYHGYLWQNGLDFFDENQNPTLQGDDYVSILEWMLEFNDEFTRSQLNAFGDENAMLGSDPFAAGRVGMMISMDGLYQTMKTYGSEINYGVTSIPIPDENGIRVNWGSGFSLELYDNEVNDDELLEGTWEFTKYLMSHDVQIEFAEANGWIMGNKDAMEDYAEGNEILTAFVEEVSYAVDKVYIPYAPSWHAADWQTYYDEALDGSKTADEALADARAWYLQKQENYNDTHK